MAAGRRTTLTPDLIVKICLAILDGNYRYVAVQAAGVPIRTFNRWCKLGKKYPEGIYGQLWHALLEAETQAEMSAVARVLKAANEDPKHAQWWLERKFPQRWGRQFRFDMKQVEQRIKELERLAGVSEEAQQTLEQPPEDSPEATGGQGE